MRAIDLYRKQLEMSRKRKNVGQIECKFRPETEYAKMIFGKHLLIEKKEENKSIFHKFLNPFELDKVKNELTERNLNDYFNVWYEISEQEYEESGYTTFKARVIENFCYKYRLSREQVSLELGEIILYPEEKELDFENIVDLRTK